MTASERAVRKLRGLVDDLVADAERNENLYMAMVLAGTKRRKRTLALADIGLALMLLRMLWHRRGRRQVVGERFSMHGSSLRAYGTGFCFSTLCWSPSAGEWFRRNNAETVLEIDPSPPTGEGRP